MVVGTEAMAAAILAVIPVLTAEVASEVTLAAPPLAVAEEEREIELPALRGGRLHGSPSRSEPKASGENVAETELEHPTVVHVNEVVDIPSDDEADVMAEPSVSP